MPCPYPPLSLSHARIALTLFTVGAVFCSMFRIHVRTFLKEFSSVVSYTSKIPMAPR